MATEEPEVKYSNYCAVYNIENDTYCYQKGIDKKLPATGSAKIMTACLAIENYRGNYLMTVTVNGDWIKEVSGQQMGYKADEEITVEDLLAALIVNNSNDSAYVLAYAISGSLEGFVELMNTKAKELGMENTVFKNPAGLDDEGMYTTVADAVKLSSYAAAQSKFTEYSGERRVSVDATNKSQERDLYNRNYFVSNYYNNRYVDGSIIGLNTANTSAAGWCLSVAGRNNAGNTYLVVIMNGDGSVVPENTKSKTNFEDDDDEEATVYGNEATGKIAAFEDAKALLKYAYENFTYFTVVDTSTMVCDVPVKLSGKVDHVILLPERKVLAFLPCDSNIEQIVEKEWELKSDVLSAPLKKGEAVGTLKVYVNGELKDEVNLVPKNNIDRSNLLFILDMAGSFLLNPITLVVGSLIILVLILLLIRKIRAAARKRHIVRYK